MIKVLVVGAAGKMGREVVKAVANDAEAELIAAIGRGSVGTDAGELAGIGNIGLALEGDLAAAIERTQPDVAVEFTTPHTVRENVHTLVSAGIPTIVGATGLVQDDLDALDQHGRENRVPIFVVPNFAVGAVLMMLFAEQAAKHFDFAEIIEYHHERKVDAPSGTAFKTAKMMREARDSDFIRVGGDTEESGSAAPGARGGTIGGISLHSLRMPGYVANQEVILASKHQTLTIKHETIHRDCYMDGVLMCIKAVGSLPPGLTYGLEKIF